MLRRHLSGGRTPERERAEAVALGMLPSGALCGVWFDSLDEELRDLLATLGDLTLEDPVHAEVNGATWTLRGRVEGITGRGRLQVRPATCKPTDLIRAWITHLALSAAFGPTMTELIATDCHTVFGEVAEPMMLLDELVAGYRAALRSRCPSSPRRATRTSRSDQAGNEHARVQDAARGGTGNNSLQDLQGVPAGDRRRLHRALLARSRSAGRLRAPSSSAEPRRSGVPQ